MESDDNLLREGSSGGPVVPGVVTLSGDGETIQFVSDDPLKANQLYWVRGDQLGAKDLAGNTLTNGSAPITFSFTTVP